MKKSLAAALVLAAVALAAFPLAAPAGSRQRSIEVKVIDRGGFHWADAAVGALAAIGLVLLVAGIAVVTRKEKVVGKSAFLSSIAVLAIAIALAAPASAAPPASERFTDRAAEPVSCDGFDALLERRFLGTVRTYFDNEGAPIRLQVKAAMTGSVTNSVTGKRVSLRGHVQLVDNLLTGTSTFTGQVFMANRHGEGVVIHDTGRVVFDADGNVVFEAGPHDAVDAGAQVFCDAVT